ncbi:MAG: hypothetical protein IJ397_01255 [Lachnospiraceae bacterium]|nr:hypothetical protein [Lachnospiraceae bacterium]
MNTDKKENTGFSENVTTTETEKPDFTFAAILAFINVTAELFCIMFLGTLHRLMDFTVKDCSNVNELHGYIFSTFAGKQGVCISNATLWIFVAGLVAMIISFTFSRKNEHKLKHLFLMLSTGLNVVAGSYYLLANLLWTNSEYTGTLAGFIFYCILLATGIAGLIWGLFFHKIKEAPHMDKWIPMTLASVLVLATCVCIAYPFITLNAERREVNALRETIANQQIGYDEEIGYQIGNYANANALYLDGKLYLTKYNPEIDAEEILSIDRNGNMEVFQIAPEEAKDFSSCLYHYDGYIYVLAHDTDSPNCQVLRISVADKTAETLLEGERHPYFGIRNNLLLIKGFDEETETHYIDAYDLSKPVTEENRYVYDYGTQTHVLDWEYFVNYYVYGNTLYRDYGSNQSAGMCVGDNFYGAYNHVGIDGVVYLQTPDTVFENSTVLDNRALQINIFDQALYYVRLADDNETYEMYTCGLSGEEKTLIGTMPRELFTDCYNLSVAEEFVIIYGNDRETETNSTYLMWLDDGSYEKLW